MINKLPNDSINWDGVYSDGTSLFRSPCEPNPGDLVKIRIRTIKNNIDKVLLIADETAYEMSVEESTDIFDFYKAEINVSDIPIRYHFELHKNGGVLYYNRKGMLFVKEAYADFEIIPGFSVPGWAKGAVMYQIFTDRFCNGDKSNDVLDREYCYIKEPAMRVRNWNEYPDAMDVRRFYGGDLAGIIKKLDYLKDLGVEVIYLNPIFVSPSNHKYDSQDYDYVDPHFGVILEDGGDVLPEGEKDNKKAERYIKRVTSKKNLEASNRLFAELVKKAHDMGIKVILDGVFNHCGSFNKWLDKEGIYEDQPGYAPGAYVSEDSPYTSFFRFNSEKWPYNKDYDGWWGHDTLPKLNYEDSDDLLNYILKIGAKWVSPPYNADGWRLDVAADLGHSPEYNHRFWKEFRKAVKTANPEAIILAEHYGNPESWLQGDEWDTVMNYDAFMEPVSWFLTGMEKHSEGYRPDLLGNAEIFFNSMTENMLHMTTSSLYVAMNELSNHDHSRFLTRTNHLVGRISEHGAKAAEENVNKAVMRAAVLMQMTWPGAPTVYYGDEAGVCGFTDPDNRRTYPWGKEDKELIAFHKEAIRIHKDYDAIKNGSLIYLKGERNFVSYGRFDEKDKVVVAVNCGEDVLTVAIPVWRIGINDDTNLLSLITSDRDGFTTRAHRYPVENGVITFDIMPYQSLILKNVAHY